MTTNYSQLNPYNSLKLIHERHDPVTERGRLWDEFDELNDALSTVCRSGCARLLNGVKVGWPEECSTTIFG